VKDALRIMIICYRKLNYTDLAANTVKVFEQNFPGESSDMKIKRSLIDRIFNRQALQAASADTR
jgi:outer membrane protein assembly factor BamD (BamD/ComL family)